MARLPRFEDISRSHRKMYMSLARAASQHATCDRAKVGAIIVKNGGIIGTGFNGSAAGDVHCDQAGHLMHGGHCIRTIHAEENAIINAAKNGGGTWGASLFCTHLPCYRCVQRIINAGISAVYYDKSYGKEDPNRDALVRVGLKLSYYLSTEG